MTSALLDEQRMCVFKKSKRNHDFEKNYKDLMR